MFERFTQSARAVVVGAQGEARQLRHEYIGTEHILLALLEVDGNGIAGTVLHDAGIGAGRVRDDLLKLLGGGYPLAESDAEALEAIGIDLDAVRAKVEESFGAGALDFPEPEPPRLIDRIRGRRKPARPGIGGHIPFTPRSKKVLELALREALALRTNYIGTEHILLGLIREGEGLATKILVDAGVDLADLRAQTVAKIKA
jgi:ATP-dependent Clp protease ATP-binding subunit ClpA